VKFERPGDEQNALFPTDHPQDEEDYDGTQKTAAAKHIKQASASRRAQTERECVGCKFDHDIPSFFATGNPSRAVTGKGCAAAFCRKSRARLERRLL
jgi:hypothetical protein